MASQTIFRTIDVATGQTITLGEPVPADVLPLTEPDGENQLKMLDGDFGGASSIVIQLTPSQNVKSIIFGYGASTNYDAMVSAFTGELGQPESQTPVLTRWSDPQTTFEVSQNASAVSSRLSDRASSTAA